MLTKMLTDCSELYAIDATREHGALQEITGNYDFLSLTL